MNLATQPLGRRPRPVHLTIRISVEAIRKSLLVCGVLSSLVYLALCVFAPLLWEGYNSRSQAVSELGAIGAPSRPLVTLLGTLYEILVIAFGVGVWASSFRNRALRVVGGLLMAYGVIGFAAPFSSMHMRGVSATHTDIMHIALTVVTVVLMFLILAYGSASLGGKFYWYTMATVVVLVLFGIWAGLDGPRLAENLPTPWLGLAERINIGSFLLWIIVLAFQLWTQLYSRIEHENA